MKNGNITGYIGGYRVSPLKVSLNYQIDTYASVKFSIPADEINLRQIRNNDYTLYLDGEYLISGVVIKRPVLIVDRDWETSI